MPKRSGSKGRGKPSLRDLSRLRIKDHDEFKAFAIELTEGSDLACALIACSYLDNMLRDLLLTYMRSDDDNIQQVMFDNEQAPLANFWDRIIIAYGIGAIDTETRGLLNQIRQIRNAFAHSERAISFLDNDIRKECEKFHPGMPLEPTSSHRKPARTAYIGAWLKAMSVIGNQMIERRRADPSVSTTTIYTLPTSPEK